MISDFLMTVAVSLTKPSNLEEKKPVPRQEQVVAYSGSWQGLASWYGSYFHGRTTASGEVFNMDALTAAHNSLPFGTLVEVTNENNGRSVVVRINDTGAFDYYGREIDLSYGAAEALGGVDAGVFPVTLRVVN